MDIQMPVMNGYEANIAVRKEEAARCANGTGHHHRDSIIAMTASTMPGEERKSFRAGMDAHIGKPIDTGLLYRNLSYCFTREYEKIPSLLL